MSNLNSQEHTIYLSLAGQIQMGFYDDKERFPSVSDIARRYQVSYCPAQRAVKALERDGLVRLCRGKETVVLKKPFVNYLQSEIFYQHAEALMDLFQSLELLSPAICFHGICHTQDASVYEQPPEGTGDPCWGKKLYRLFERSLLMLGSRTVLSLYYDIGSFSGSAFLDLLYALPDKEYSGQFLRHLTECFGESVRDYQQGRYSAARLRFEDLGRLYFQELRRYMGIMPRPDSIAQTPFIWEPQKGREHYCDVIATDLICKVNQGQYPVGSLLPTSSVLADIYHVSVITMRRSIQLLTKLGIVKSLNGIGVQVIFAGDSSIPYKLKDLMMDHNLRTFLEALQLLYITCETVIQYAFPYFPPQTYDLLLRVTHIKEQKIALSSAISATLQAIVHHCPLAAVKEIYEKITILLLKGSVLRIEETGKEKVPFWPQLSAELGEAVLTRDGARFAAAFRRITEESFLTAKQILLEIGVAGVEDIVSPISHSDCAATPTK